MKKILLVIFILNAAIASAQDNGGLAEAVRLKQNIEAVNNVFLKKIFVNNYFNNTDYFLNTDLSKENPSNDLFRANVLLNSLKLTLSGDSLRICKKALDFNENYSSLYQIANGGLLNAKYDKLKISKVINAIVLLPALDKGSKLDNTKAKIRLNLENYATSTISLRAELDKAKKPDQDNPAVKKEYLSLEKKYAQYPYLVKVIQESKNGKNTYPADLDVAERSNATPNSQVIPAEKIKVQ